MFWKSPPIIKIYEALGSLADGRLEVVSDTEAKVYSSSGNKFYIVKWDPGTKSIMTNDNGSFWQGYLGYPALAFLMQISELAYDKQTTEALKDIAWKDINQKYKNNFDKTLTEVMQIVADRGFDPVQIEASVSRTYDQLQSQQYLLLGKKIRPPSAY